MIVCKYYGCLQLYNNKEKQKYEKKENHVFFIDVGYDRSTSYSSVFFRLRIYTVLFFKYTMVSIDRFLIISSNA